MKNKQRTSKARALSAAELDAIHDAGAHLASHMELTKLLSRLRLRDGGHRRDL